MAMSSHISVDSMAEDLHHRHLFNPVGHADPPCPDIEQSEMDQITRDRRNSHKCGLCGIILQREIVEV